MRLPRARYAHTHPSASAKLRSSRVSAHRLIHADRIVRGGADASYVPANRRPEFVKITRLVTPEDPNHAVSRSHSLGPKSRFVSRVTAAHAPTASCGHDVRGRAAAWYGTMDGQAARAGSLKFAVAL